MNEGSIGSILAGFLMDGLAKRGFSPLACRKIPLVPSMIGMAAVTIATAYASDNFMIILYISIAYFLGGVSTAAIWAMVTAAAPPDYIGSFGSILLIGGYMGATCSPIVTGVIVDRTGSFLIALLIGAGMALFGAAAFLLLITRPITGADLDAASARSPTTLAGAEK
jgi:MFS family permease